MTINYKTISGISSSSTSTSVKSPIDANPSPQSICIKIPTLAKDSQKSLTLVSGKPVETLTDTDLKAFLIKQKTSEREYSVFIHELIIEHLQLKNERFILRLLNQAKDTLITKASPLEDYLILASKFGCAEVVKSLLQNKLNINAKDEQEVTSLNYACEKGHTEVVRELLKKGADVTIEDFLGSPLGIACMKGFPRIVELLIDQGKANPNDYEKDGNTALQVLLQGNGKNRFEIFQILLQRHADVYKKTGEGQSVLLKAIGLALENKNPILAQKLIDGIPFHEKINKTGETLLHVASKYRNFDIVSMIVNKIPKNDNSLINIQDNDGDTPLHAACANGNNDKIVELLLKHGADPTILSNEHISPGTYCILNQNSYAHLFQKIPEVRNEINIKLVALSNSLEGKEIYEGGYNEFMQLQIARTLDFLPKQFYDKKEELVSAFKKASNTIDPETAAKEIREGKLTIIPCGWEEHAINLVFYKDYMAICNRGEGAEGQLSTIEVFKIDPKKVVKALFESIFNFRVNDESEFGIDFYYKVIPSKLSPNSNQKPMKDDLCKLLKEERLSPKPQKAQNCPFASAKAALRFALAILCLEKEVSLDPKKIIGDVIEATKLWSTGARLQFLCEYLEQYSGPDDPRIDLSFIEAAWGKIQKRKGITENDRMLMEKYLLSKKSSSTSTSSTSSVLCKISGIPCGNSCWCTFTNS